MNFLQSSVNRAMVWLAKCLKNGADWRLRTPDPLITKPVASLKTNGLSVNRRPDVPQKTVTFRSSVNRSHPHFRRAGAV